MNFKIIILLILVFGLGVLVGKHKYTSKRIGITIEKIKALVEKVEIKFEKFTSPVIDKNAPKRFYAINLKTSPHKMEYIKKQSDQYNLNIERFDAVNGYKAILLDTVTKNIITGADLKQNPKLLELGRRYDVYCDPDSYKSGNKPDISYINGYSKDLIVPHKNILTAGEIGINCSSKRLWKKIADANNQIAVIFEDDVQLGHDFDKKIQDIFAALPKKWDLIYIDYLGYEDDSKIHSVLEKINDKLLKHDGTFSTWGAHAYIINSSSAKKLLKVQEKRGNVPLDNVLVEAVRSLRLDAYITAEKVAQVNFDLGSDITSMGRK